MSYLARKKQIRHIFRTYHASGHVIGGCAFSAWWDTQVDDVSHTFLRTIQDTVKPVLSGPRIKRTPSIKWTPAWVPKFSSHIYCKINLRSADTSVKVIPLKLFYYQTFFETWRNEHSWYEHYKNAIKKWGHRACLRVRRLLKWGIFTGCAFKVRITFIQN